MLTKSLNVPFTMQGKKSMPQRTANDMLRAIRTHLENGRLRTAYNVMIRAFKAFFTTDRETVEQCVDLVFIAHLRAGLVSPTSNDERAWENTILRIRLHYGRVRGGRIPHVSAYNDSLPRMEVWGQYVDIGDKPERDRLFYINHWASNHHPSFHVPSYTGWTPVAPPGNKLRLLIRHYHMHDKYKKLLAFCQRHGLPMPID